MDKKPGRPATGRSSNPDYFRLTAYIPKALYKQVQKSLIDADLNTSELVEQLLKEWVSAEVSAQEAAAKPQRKRKSPSKGQG